MVNNEQPLRQAVQFLKLPCLPHDIVDQEMRRLQKMRIKGEIGDTVLFVTHPEIVTIGPRARKEGVEIPSSYASAPVDRGGSITWHGEGQIICYPIIEWKKAGEENVAVVIRKLEEWIISALESLGINGRRDERMQGVWVGDNKVASIGLSFLHWTSRHGFTINYDTPLGRVEELSGCGLGQAITTSLSALGYEIGENDLHAALFSSTSSIDRDTSEIEHVADLASWMNNS
jgi:lipoate-protein ligase B